ncbi:MAG: hypothetical protein RLZZ76_464 [Candidatus Parcubacteria bacterium]|jgi:hypothetical protein
MEQNTARNFALQLGSLITLYVSIVAVLMVVFGAINVLYPDAASYGWEYSSAQEGMRTGIAMLVVFFPVFLITTRMVNRIRRTETGTYLVLTKWLVYLSLLVGGAVLLGDIVTVILGYLNGELTTRFVLKAASLAVVLSAALFYYVKDAQGYWLTHEKESKLYGLVAIAIAVAALTVGFMFSDSPSKVREMKLDAEQVANLSDMQWRIEDHYRINKSLPKTTDELYVGISPAKAPESRTAYEYKVTDEDTYQLCATFMYPSTPINASTIAYVDSSMKNPYNNWDHGQGVTCFERTIVKEMVPMPL